MAAREKGTAVIYRVKLEAGAVCPTQNCLKKSCFFLVSHIREEAVIRALAECLLKAGCRDFHFWGDREGLWHLLFDEVDVERTLDNDLEDVAMTSGYSDIQDFAWELRMQSPQDCCLFYDDAETYRQVLQGWD